MVKSVRIGISNTQGTSEPKRNGCATDKTGQIDTKFLRALKILTGLCIGQMVMVATTAGTLAVFVNENFNQIEELKRTSDKFQYTKNESDWKSAYQDLESRMIDFDTYGERIAELEKGISSIRNTSERLIKLESTIMYDNDFIKEHSEALTNISEQISHIVSDPTISYRVSDIENNRMSDLSIIQAFNDTVTILAKQVAEAETNRHTSTVQNITKMISEIQLETMTSASIIQDHNITLTYQSNRIAELASTKSEVQNNTDRINKINLNRKSDITLIQQYNGTLTFLGKRITVLEADKATIQTNGNEITELQTERLSTMSILNEHNDTLISLGIQMTQLLSDRPVIQNNSDQITELALNQIEVNDTLTDLAKRVAELETGFTLVQNAAYVITTQHNKSFNNIGDQLAALKPYCYIAMNNSARLDKLQLDRKSDNSLIQEHNSSLQNVQSRLTSLKESLKMPSYSFYAHKITQTRIFAGDVLIFSTIQLDESEVYNNTTGKYTAQTDGIYIFHGSLCLEGNGSVYVNFVGGHNVIGTIRSGDFNGRDCSAGTATARLQKGDEVYLDVSLDTNSIVVEDEFRRNSFSGQLISG